MVGPTVSAMFQWAALFRQTECVGVTPPSATESPGIGRGEKLHSSPSDSLLPLPTVCKAPVQLA
jgi:hypothetical protein